MLFCRLWRRRLEKGGLWSVPSAATVNLEPAYVKMFLYLQELWWEEAEWLITSVSLGDEVQRPPPIPVFHSCTPGLFSPCWPVCLVTCTPALASQHESTRKLILLIFKVCLLLTQTTNVSMWPMILSVSEHLPPRASKRTIACCLWKHSTVLFLFFTS